MSEGCNKKEADTSNHPVTRATSDQLKLQPLKWSFLARSKNCPAQQWHMDNDKGGYFMVMPLYPCGGKKTYYSVSVVKGSHNIKYEDPTDVASIEDLTKYLDDILHLQLKVGQVLVADAKIWHRGGPNSKCDELMGTYDFPEEDYKIPAIRNLSLHGYLKCEGTNVDSKDSENTQLIKLPQPKKEKNQG